MFMARYVVLKRPVLIIADPCEDPSRRDVRALHWLLFLQTELLTAGDSKHHLQHLHADSHPLNARPTDHATLRDAEVALRGTRATE